MIYDSPTLGNFFLGKLGLFSSKFCRGCWPRYLDGATLHTIPPEADALPVSEDGLSSPTENQTLAHLSMFWVVAIHLVCRLMPTAPPVDLWGIGGFKNYNRNRLKVQPKVPPLQQHTLSLRTVE